MPIACPRPAMALLTAVLCAASIATVAACSRPPSPSRPSPPPAALTTPAGGAAPLAAAPDAGLLPGMRRDDAGLTPVAIDPSMALAGAVDAAGRSYVRIQHYPIPPGAAWTLYRDDTVLRTGTTPPAGGWWPLHGPGRYAVQVAARTIAVWTMTGAG